MSDCSKGSHGQEIVEAKTLPARGDFKGVLGVRHGGRNVCLQDTDAASYLHADKTWSRMESLSCFNFPDPAGFDFCLQISELVLQMGIALLAKETPFTPKL